MWTIVYGDDATTGITYENSGNHKRSENMALVSRQCEVSCRSERVIRKAVVCFPALTEAAGEVGKKRAARSHRLQHADTRRVIQPQFIGGRSPASMQNTETCARPSRSLLKLAMKFSWGEKE